MMKTKERLQHVIHNVVYKQGEVW